LDPGSSGAAGGGFDKSGSIPWVGKVVHYDAANRRLTLDRDVPSWVMPGDVIELDAGLEAPVLAARRLIGCPLGQALPPIDMRLGTTRGTNALLTRRGADVALVTTRGFGDLLEIGEQSRPELFELSIRKPQPLTRRVIEIDQRMDEAGKVLRPLDEEELIAALQGLRAEGVSSLAICLLHSHVNDAHERRIGELAAPFGFTNVSLSSRIAPLIKLVARAETTVLDAYLNPILQSYIARIAEQLGSDADRSGRRSRLRLMTSAGNLVDASAFRGCDSILSGPAGGVVSLGKVAKGYDAPAAIGLDMGGTSTDVSRFEGRVARQYESRKAGVRVLTPMVAVHTVAAGGGSICDYFAGRMVVGPQSAGADPGPACYGRGGPLAVTDLNVVLGRLPADRFPFPLDIAAARQRLAEVNAKMGSGRFATIEEAAEGFLKIAVTHMAEAVRTVSTAQGADPRGMTMVGFGGAAGGHLCGIADEIGITRLIDHRDASLLSALGMGLADIGRVVSVGVYRPLDSLDADFWRQTQEDLRGRALRAMEGELLGDNAAVTMRFEADVRYQGVESALPLEIEPIGTLAERFHSAHREAFGYDQRHRAVEIAAVRCEAILPSEAELDPPAALEARTGERDEADVSRPEGAGGQSGAMPILHRRRVVEGTRLDGPCVVIDDTSTLVIDRGWVGIKLPGDSFELIREAKSASAAVDGSGCNANGSAVQEADAVMVEVVARRLQGIADEMGELLRRTAVSVNVKERLDFSCAVFDADGTLLANAPHVPVHLGAMGHTVKHLMSAYPEMFPGDVYVSNDPYAGGSHLPDVTVVTPVFCDRGSEGAIGNEGLRSSGRPDFYVASRAHHAEIGGKTPGSMPPDATNLAEEGVLISSFALSRDGVENESGLRDLLTGHRYPSRAPELNLADIAAQRAAGVAGSRRVIEMVTRLGRGLVDSAARRMLGQASDAVGRWIETLGKEPRSFSDTLDDGTRIAVRLVPRDGRLTIDFTGTAGVHPRCFNAPQAITTAATLYVIRCLIGGVLPMNGGITSRIDFVIPSGLLNPQAGADPSRSPAVVAGNVETSMRVVDVLLGALRVAAASQGTMNNVLIGDATFGYYETIGGGSGATAESDGASGVHCHMTNTRITDPEIYETRYPVRLWQFALREGSGGGGRHRGGDGLIREIEFLRPVTLSLITNRRGDHRPWGMEGGGPGKAGRNVLVDLDGKESELPAAVTRELPAGYRLRIETPGGGGWGRVDR
jgi:5-oxoprolinase (ATP-hydrolysing)